jgi:hypothetical protein
MYHDRTAWRCAFFVGKKNMDAAKDIHKEMLPIWAATCVNTTRYCKYSQVLLMMGENIAQNM